MSELRNCPECGRLFSYLTRNLCSKCIDKEEEDFKIIRTYIRENPGANIPETSQATEISEEKILYFLREGRLISTGLKKSVVLRCERCGGQVDEGRYCRKCMQELGREFQQPIEETNARRSRNAPSDLGTGRIRIMDMNKRDKR